ncbi:MAG: hypothetical protein HQL17_08705, partial [Candidatus Omnitrophica bacterium]|nr:hypothetical protein [Candidatus Omnitrophota bacterium]
ADMPEVANHMPIVGDLLTLAVGAPLADALVAEANQQGLIQKAMDHRNLDQKNKENGAAFKAVAIAKYRDREITPTQLVAYLQYAVDHPATPMSIDDFMGTAVKAEVQKPTAPPKFKAPERRVKPVLSPRMTPSTPNKAILPIFFKLVQNHDTITDPAQRIESEMNIYRTFKRALTSGVISTRNIADRKVRDAVIKAVMQAPELMDLLGDQELGNRAMKAVVLAFRLEESDKTLIKQIENDQATLDMPAQMSGEAFMNQINSTEFKDAIRRAKEYAASINAAEGMEYLQSDEFGSSFRASSVAAKKGKDGAMIVNMDDATWYSYYLKKFENDPVKFFGTLVRGRTEPLSKLSAEDLAKTKEILTKLVGQEDAVVASLKGAIEDVPAVAERSIMVKEVLTLALGANGAASVLAKLAAQGGAIGSDNKLVVKKLNPAVAKMLGRYRRGEITRNEIVAYLNKWEYELSKDNKVVYKTEEAALKAAGLKAGNDDVLASKLKVRKAIARYRSGKTTLTQLQNYMKLMAANASLDETPEQTEARNRALYAETYDRENVMKARTARIEELKDIIKRNPLLPGQAMPTMPVSPLGMNDGLDKFTENADGTISSQEGMNNELIIKENNNEGVISEKKAFEATLPLKQIDALAKITSKVGDFVAGADGVADSYAGVELIANDAAQSADPFWIFYRQLRDQIKGLPRNHDANDIVKKISRDSRLSDYVEPRDLFNVNKIYTPGQATQILYRVGQNKINGRHVNVADERKIWDFAQKPQEWQDTIERILGGYENKPKGAAHSDTQQDMIATLTRPDGVLSKLAADDNKPVMFQADTGSGKSAVVPLIMARTMGKTVISMENNDGQFRQNFEALDALAKAVKEQNPEIDLKVAQFERTGNVETDITTLKEIVQNNNVVVLRDIDVKALAGEGFDDHKVNERLKAIVKDTIFYEGEFIERSPLNVTGQGDKPVKKELVDGIRRMQDILGEDVNDLETRAVADTFVPFSKSAMEKLIAYFNSDTELNGGKTVTSEEELRGQPKGMELIAYMQAYIEALANYRSQKVAIPVGAKEPGLKDSQGNINSGVRPQDDLIAIANRFVANKHLKQEGSIRNDEHIDEEAILSQQTGVQVNDMNVVSWMRDAQSRVVLASGSITGGISKEAQDLFGVSEPVISQSNEQRRAKADHEGVFYGREGHALEADQFRTITQDSLDTDLKQVIKDTNGNVIFAHALMGEASYEDTSFDRFVQRIVPLAGPRKVIILESDGRDLILDDVTQPLSTAREFDSKKEMNNLLKAGHNDYIVIASRSRARGETIYATREDKL